MFQKNVLKSRVYVAPHTNSLFEFRDGSCGCDPPRPPAPNNRAENHNFNRLVYSFDD